MTCNSHVVPTLEGVATVGSWILRLGLNDLVQAIARLSFAVCIMGLLFVCALGVK